MASNGGRINFQVGFNVDKSGLNSLKSSLQSLQKMKITDFSGTNEELRQIKNTAKQVQQALQKAFNTNLGSLNVNKFNQELQKSKLNVNQIYSQFSKAGAQGQAAFSKMAQSVLTTNLQLRQTNSLVSKMGTTLMNTIKWNISSSIVQNFTNSIRQAFQYVQALDASLTDIRIVTGDSTDQMRQFAKQANNAAQALGRSTMDYTKAALTFYQQGLDDQSVAARTQATLQAQNITGAGEQMADYLTAVWNGYKVANEQAQLYVDRLAAVADSSASNMAQLATAMSKVAATANAMGVDVDQLNAQIATIIATTRQAPQTVGNALKTIFARINDIQAGTQDAEVSLGHYTGTMAELGINVLDASGHLRDTGQVMEEIGEKWATMSREQQIYLARTMAGQRQYNNLIALFDNWGRYTELVNVSMDSQGTLMEKNSRYMDSLGAKMEQLGAAGEKVKDALIDEEDMKGLITAATKIVSTFGSFIQSIGGARGALLVFGSLATQIFSGVISKQITAQITNFQNYKNNLNQIAEAERRVAQEGQNSFNRGQLKLYINDLRDLHASWRGLTNQQKIEQQNRANEIRDLRSRAAVLRENVQQAQKFAEALTGSHKDIAGSNSTRLLSFVKNVKENLDSASQAADRFFTHISNSTVEDQPLQNLANTVSQLVRNLGTAATADERQLAEYLDRLARKSQEASIDINDLDTRLTNFFARVKGTSNNLEFVVKADGSGAISQLHQVQQETKKTKQTFNEVNQTGKQFLDVQGIVKFASGLGQIASGINGIINLTKIWKDENLSFGEKVLQTFTNLGMTIGMLSNGFKLVTENFGSISDAIIKLAAKVVAMKTAQTAANGAVATSATGAAVAEGVKTGADMAQAASSQAAAAGNMSLAASIATLISTIAPFVAIGAAVAVSIYALYQAWNKSSIQAEKASAAAQKAKQQYEEVKQTYDDLKQSLEDYHSAQDALNELTRGTQQWRDALLEANEAVLQLLNTYPQLAQYVSNQNGRLVISEEGQQALLDAQYQQVIAAQRTSTALAAQSRQANIYNQAVQLSRQTGGDFNANEVIALANEYIRNNGIIENISRQAYPLLFEGPEFNQLISAIQANTAATENANEALIENTLQGNSIYEGFTNAGQEVATAIGGAAYQASIQSAYELMDTFASSAITRLATANTVVGSRNIDGRQVSQTLQDWLNEYNQIQGTNYQFGSNVVQSTDQGLMINLRNQMGETLQVTRQQMQMTIATARAMSDIQGTTLENIRQINDAIANSGYEDALNSWITSGGLGDLTQAEVDALSTLDLNQIFDDNIGIIAERFGWEEQEVAQKFSELINHYNDGVDSVVDNLYFKVQQAFNNLDLRNFTANQRSNIARQLNRAYVQRGTEGLDNLSQFYERLNNFSQEDRQAFDELTNSIDFNYITVTRFRNLMQQAGIHTSATNEVLQAYIEAQQTAAQLIDYQTRYSHFQQLGDKLTEIGSIIQSSQYDQLAQQLSHFEIQADEYFTHMADGTYQLIDISDEFRHAINRISTQALENSIQSQRNQADRANSYGSVYQQHNGDINRLTNQQRVQFLLDVVGEEQLGDAAQSILAMRDSIRDGQQLDRQQTEYLMTTISRYADQWNNINQYIGISNDQLADQQEQLANTVESVDDLWSYFDKGLFLDVEGELNEDAFNRAFESFYQNVAEEYDISSEAAQQFSASMENALLSAEDFQGGIQDAARAATDLTDYTAQLNEGLEDLQSTWDDYAEIIGNSNASAWEQAQAIAALQASIESMFGIQVSDDFITQHLQLIQAAAYGDIDALTELGNLAAQDFFFNLELDDAQFGQDLDNIINTINSLDGQTMQFGADLNDQDFVNSLNHMLDAGVITADQVRDALNTIGYTPNIEFIHKEVGGTTSDIATNTDVAQTEVTGNIMGLPFRGTLTTTTTRTTGGAMSDAHQIVIPQIVPGSKGGTGVTYTKPIQSNNIRTNLKAPNFGGTRAPKTSKSGGGGGKGSGSTAKPSIQKASQDQRDPYHDINRLLDKQEQKLKNIQNQDKKLVNRDRLNNINAQNKALEEQANLLENKLAIAESQEIRLRNQLLADTNGYAQFGRDGELTNFNQMLANAQQQYNNYIAYYNTLTKEQQDAEKDRLELQKERYERVKDTAKEYEETLDLQRDLLEQINEAQEKQYENLIKASKIKVDLSIDAGDAERDWLDFENKVIKKLDKDDFLGNAKANIKELMSYFDSDQVQNTAKQIQSIRNQIAIMERGGTSSIYGNNLAQAKEDLEQYMKQQMDDLEKVQSLVDKIKEKYLDGIKQAKKQMDDQIDQYERVNDLIEHNVKLTQMLYGDKAYDTMNKYYELQERNNKAELDSLKKQQDFWQQKMNNEVVDSDAWNEFRNNLDNVTDDLNKKLEDMIDNLSDKWQNRVDGIIDKLNNSLTGGRGLDYLDEQWDYINDFDDNFLDAVESKLGIQQVQNLYEQAVADTAGDAKQQQRITDLMNQQIKILREKDKLTEYDVERAKAVLDVEKARMALEDARNNKTKMRLRRDSQGNYTYQYVADEEKLDDLQQALNDAQLNLYNQDKQHYKQNLDKLYDTYKDYIEKMRDLTAEYNATQDEEERARIQARIDLLKSASDEMMASLTEDNRQLLNYLDGSTLSALGIDGTQLTGEEIRQIVTTTVPQASSKIQDLTNSIAGQGGLLQATAATLQEIVNTTDEYDKAVADILEMGGTSLDVITTVVDATGQAIDNNIVNVEKLIAQNDELIKSCDDQISVIQKLMSWLDQYMNKVMDVERLIANLRAAHNTDQVLNDSNLRALNEVLADTNLDTTAGMDVTSTVATNLSAAKKQIDALISIYERNLIETLSKSAAFDTGGYTGSWEDQSGKLAILHGKELVLNENDTTNILAAVQVIRDITSALSGFIDRDIGNTVNDIGSIINTPTTEHDILDQNVHIEANFPNVTQHTQIEQAFNNLVNIASQYAARPATV